MMDKQAVFQWVKQQYGTQPDYPWQDPNAVLRHPENNKWYGLVMAVGKDKLDLPGEGTVDILNVKSDPVLIGSLRTQPGFHPAYHMNKDQWLSIRLDGSVPESQVKNLLELSFALTRPKKKKVRRIYQMNEVLKTIAARYSCRSFDGRLPKKEELEAIALAAVQSPSGLNKQPWQVNVITDKAFIEEMDDEGMRILKEGPDQSIWQRFMDRGGNLYYNAPCMFLILKRPGTELDCGIVSENIALAAASLGLGSVICGMAAIPFQGPKGEAFKERAGFEGDWEFGVAVLVGYAAGSGKPHEPDLGKVKYIDGV